MATPIPPACWPLPFANDPSSSISREISASRLPACLWYPHLIILTIKHYTSHFGSSEISSYSHISKYLFCNVTYFLQRAVNCTYSDPCLFLFQDICIVNYGRMGQSFELAINCKYSDRCSILFQAICTVVSSVTEIFEGTINCIYSDHCNIPISEYLCCWQLWDRSHQLDLVLLIYWKVYQTCWLKCYHLS